MLAHREVLRPGWAAKEAPRGQRWEEELTGGTECTEASSLQSKDTWAGVALRPGKLQAPCLV